MRFDILTVVPELLESPLSHSIVGRAIDKGLVEIHVHNLRKYGKEKEIDGVILDGNARADRIIKKLHTIAPAAIRKSKEKISSFKRSDGGYSYFPSGSTSHSQGMPVSIPGREESDVNGCIIASHELVGYIYSALGLSKYKVPMFGAVHFERYMEIVENNKARMKNA